MKVNTQKLIEYWNTSSDEKWKTAEGLFKLDRNSDALFFCCLAIEMKLKAIVVKKLGDYAPHTHDLQKLARVAQIEITPERQAEFAEIETFNINARYDTYKFEFYKKATREYTEKYFTVSRNTLLWLSSIQSKNE